MIKSISAGAGLSVSGSTNSLPYINMSIPSAGMMRYNGNSQCIEIYDGTTWLSLYFSNASISLDFDALELLRWVKEYKNREIRVQKLAENDTSVRTALDHVNDAKEKLDIIITLKESKSASTS